MKTILQKILRILAKRVINRYQPVVIGVTGSVGKSTAKEAIYAVLARKFKTIKSFGNFNQEIGMPLAILGIEPFYKDKNSFLNRINFFLRILKKTWLAFGYPKGRFAKVAVLEMAADRPGDIKYLTDIARPNVGVITAVGEVPVHVEFYASPKEVALEKSSLVRNLPPRGLAVLNFDDQTVLDMREVTKAKIATFGFSDKADIWASDMSYFIDEDSKEVGGLSFKIRKNGNSVPIRLPKTIAVHQIYGILAATAVGVYLGLSLNEISLNLENIEIPESRMTLKKGIRNSIIIDDTYNSSPMALHAALDTLKKFGDIAIKLKHGKGRKIAVLGDMKELGKYEIQAHQTAGNLAGERADVLITVGAAAKFIADAAGNQMKKENIMSFSTAEEARDKVKEIMKEGDIILVKGSHSMRMEEVVKGITT